MEVPRHRGSVHLDVPSRDWATGAQGPGAGSPRNAFDAPCRHPPRGGETAPLRNPPWATVRPSRPVARAEIPFHRRIIQPYGGVVAVKRGAVLCDSKDCWNALEVLSPAERFAAPAKDTIRN